ncbi:MAG: RHS repeat-associated core domain-containing protein [Phycisphaerales bacterium]|nr:RHS repeat-associated core domain-containing protein [Phycisphaerales bacterium]
MGWLRRSSTCGGCRVSAALFEQAGTIGGLLAVRVCDVSGAPEPDDPVDYVYLYDALGNVGQVVDWSHDAQQPGAALAARYEYDPYGGVTKADGDYAAHNAWRFSTKQWDDETGLGWWGKRYYDGLIGRWMSWDPIGERGGLNLYAFARNAPLDYVVAIGLTDRRDGARVLGTKGLGSLYDTTGGPSGGVDSRVSRRQEFQARLARIRSRHRNTCYYSSAIAPIVDRLEQGLANVRAFGASSRSTAMGTYRHWGNKLGVDPYGADDFVIVHELAHAYVHLEFGGTTPEERLDEGIAHMVEAWFTAFNRWGGLLERAFEEDICPSGAILQKGWSGLWMALNGEVACGWNAGGVWQLNNIDLRNAQEAISKPLKAREAYRSYARSR